MVNCSGYDDRSPCNPGAAGYHAAIQEGIGAVERVMKQCQASATLWPMFDGHKRFGVNMFVPSWHGGDSGSYTIGQARE